MTQKQLKEAILMVASQLENNQTETFKALIQANVGYPTIVKELVWLCFVNKVEIRCSSSQYLTRIWNYARQLRMNGYYTFD